MTKARASRQPAKPLNSQHQEFVRLFLAGPDGVRGNQTRAAETAGFAGAYGRRLMADPRIKAAIAKFHKAADKAVERQLEKWASLAPDAQHTVVQIQNGKLAGAATRLRVRLDAAIHVLDRALGKPVAKLQHSGSLIDDLLKDADSADAGAAGPEAASAGNSA